MGKYAETAVVNELVKGKSSTLQRAIKHFDARVGRSRASQLADQERQEAVGRAGRTRLKLEKSDFKPEAESKDPWENVQSEKLSTLKSLEKQSLYWHNDDDDDDDDHDA